MQDFYNNSVRNEKAGSIQTKRGSRRASIRDNQRRKAIGNCERIENVSQSEKPTNIKESTWKEVADVVGKVMSESALGPHGSPKKDNKKCTYILKRPYGTSPILYHIRKRKILEKKEI